MPSLTITEYTDPACPFAWSAEPARRRLEWLYGDQLQWELRMVGLSDTAPPPGSTNGFTPERASAGMRHLAGRHGMPMDTTVRPRLAATVPACRAVVAVRRHRPESERAMLRALRVLHFGGRLLDEPETIADAATRAGLDPAEVQAWIDEPETEALLREDLAESRDPSEEAVALRHKLARNDEGYRYTCPSYEVSGERGTLSVPGFQPVESYEVAVANLLPDAERRSDPTDVADVLRWAGEPLATAEVAAVCGIGLDDARQQLGRVAEEEHLGFDGLWHLNGAA